MIIIIIIVLYVIGRKFADITNKIWTYYYSLKANGCVFPNVSSLDP